MQPVLSLHPSSPPVSPSLKCRANSSGVGACRPQWSKLETDCTRWMDNEDETDDESFVSNDIPRCSVIDGSRDGLTYFCSLMLVANKLNSLVNYFIFLIHIFNFFPLILG
ncbi:hypothetical protein CRENBAI_008689 [Crenichthys baileyi]|uniref:Uncharacterized protein n=1 Tax=Crenichthys baileyi TaxID=28760 RepID=A0AAV9RST6_9TELE